MKQISNKNILRLLLMHCCRNLLFQLTNTVACRRAHFDDPATIRIKFFLDPFHILFFCKFFFIQRDNIRNFLCLDLFKELFVFPGNSRCRIDNKYSRVCLIKRLVTFFHPQFPKFSFIV